MAALQDIQLLSLNYGNFLSTISRSEQILKSANAEFNQFNSNIKKYNPVSNNYQPQNDGITEEEIQKYIENQPIILKVVNKVGELFVRGIITYIFSRAGGVPGAVLSYEAQKQGAELYDQYFIKQPVRDFLEMKRKPVKIKEFVPSDVLRGGDGSGQMFFDMFDRMMEKEEQKRIGNKTPIPREAVDKYPDGWLKRMATFVVNRPELFDEKNYKQPNSEKGNQKKKQTQQKVYKKKVYKKPKPKTTADEDFGDDFLNKTYNTTKTAFETSNAKFDKSKLLVESINFENAYLKAFDKEIDYKKEIGILQDELSKLEGDDLATKQKQLELKLQINSLEDQQKADKQNKINTFLSDESALIENSELTGNLMLTQQLGDMVDGIKDFLKDDSLSYSIKNYLLKLKKGYEDKLDEKLQRKPIETLPETPYMKRQREEQERKKTARDKADSDAGITKENKKDPVALFGLMVKHASQLGSSMQSLMNTLNIGADTFVGKLVSGFNTALSIISDVLSIFQAIKNIQAIGSALKAIPFLSWLPFAEGGSIPGTGDTDSVPAMLTPGEFVIRKSVVNKVGSGFFEWINGGGLMNSLAGHYAGGGMVAAGGTLQLELVGDARITGKGSDLRGVITKENFRLRRSRIKL